MDWLIKHSKWIVITGLIGWVIAGFLPIMRYGVTTEAGVFGDSFGMATSLFTGISFAFALLALMMQIKESNDSGIRALEQEKLQAEQVRLQGEQARIAKETAEIQQSIRKDTQRALALDVLRQVYEDSDRYVRAYLHNFGVSMSGLLDHHTNTDAGFVQAELHNVESRLLSHRFTLEMMFGAGEASEVNALIDELVKLKGSKEEAERIVLEIRNALEPLWQQMAA